MSKHPAHERALRAVAQTVRDHCQFLVGSGHPEDRDRIIIEHNEQIETVERAITDYRWNRHPRGRGRAFSVAKLKRIPRVFSIVPILVAACLLSGCVQIDHSRTWTAPSAWDPMPYYSLKP